MRIKISLIRFVVVVVTLCASAFTTTWLLHQPTHAQSAGQGPRLYVLDCGTLITNYPENYNLTRKEVKNSNMSDPCYLVVHPKGALLFDTGLPDADSGRGVITLSGTPNTDSTAWFMIITKTLKGQLAEIGYTPTSKKNSNLKKIDYLALSHSHIDHIGNANDYASSTWLVQKPEYQFMFAPNVSPQSLNSYGALKSAKIQFLEGDHDVFGDGTVVLKSTPGHTPGHQSLYLKLVKTGGIVLSGDIFHYPEERTRGVMPDREKTTETGASRAELETFLKKVGAQLWIGHDIEAFAKLKKSPAYYD